MYLEDKTPTWVQTHGGVMAGLEMSGTIDVA